MGDRPTAHRPQSTDHCLPRNGNHNVVAYISAATGAIVAEYDYGPFGELLRATGPLAKEFTFLFSTKYHDWETGLYYYGYRYYNPATGRWLSRDPIEEEGGLNFYGFVSNNPINYCDKLGLRPVTITIYFRDITISQAVKDEVNRILQDCLKSCVKKCPKTGKAEHQVFLNWVATKKQDVKKLNLGFQESPPLGILNYNPAGYNVELHGAPDLSFLGQTAGDKVGVNTKLVSDAAVIGDHKYDQALASVIAHEIFHHAVGGTWGHPAPSGYVDSRPAAVGGKLSPKACEELCDELDID